MNKRAEISARLATLRDLNEGDEVVVDGLVPRRSGRLSLLGRVVVAAANVVIRLQDAGPLLRAQARALRQEILHSTQWYMMMMKSCTVVYEQNDAANDVTSFQDHSSASGRSSGSGNPADHAAQLYLYDGSPAQWYLFEGGANWSYPLPGPRQ